MVRLDSITGRIAFLVFSFSSIDRVLFLQGSLISVDIVGIFFYISVYSVPVLIGDMLGTGMCGH